MHLTTRNVTTAFRTLVGLFASDGWLDRGGGVRQQTCEIARRPSRNGPVMKVDEPVVITYTHPRERVLLNAARDASPFFHLYHALWLLAGRNDVKAPAYYAKRYADYSDDGVTSNGSYGYRWRKATGYDGDEPLGHIDQLDVIITHLKADPISRRAVLQMWNVEDDLLKIGPGPKSSKDVCCNTSVMFSIRTTPRDAPVGEPDDGVKRLDVTVTNRSNDLVWGCLGEDFVTFSVLQEYVAARLGCEVGLYHHFSNDLHVYEGNWRPKEWLASPVVDQSAFRRLPLVRDPATFEAELQSIVNAYADGLHAVKGSTIYFLEPFFMDVAQPMFQAFGCHKADMPNRAIGWAEQVGDDDWRTAARGWLTKRYSKRERA